MTLHEIEDFLEVLNETHDGEGIPQNEIDEFEDWKKSKGLS